MNYSTLATLFTSEQNNEAPSFQFFSIIFLVGTFGGSKDSSADGHLAYVMCKCE